MFEAVGPGTAVHISVLEVGGEEVVDLLLLVPRLAALQAGRSYSLKGYLTTTSKLPPVCLPASSPAGALDMVQVRVHVRVTRFR